MSNIWLSSRRRSVLTVGGDVTVTGLRELEQSLFQIGGFAATKAGQEALLQSAGIVVETAGALAPEQEGGPSAKIWHKRTFWGHVPGRQRKVRLKYAKPIRRTDNYGSIKSNLRATVIPSIIAGAVTVAVHTGNAFWALFNEIGTKPRAAKERKNANRGRMTPHPFLAPALNISVPFVLSGLARQMQHSIRRAARGWS